MNKARQWERDLAFQKLEEGWKPKPVDSATANWRVAEAKIQQPKVLSKNSLQKGFEKPVKKVSLGSGIRNELKQ